MDISESVSDILSREEPVTDVFYRHFFARHPLAEPMFENVDLAHQATLLKMALSVIEQFYRFRYPAAEHYLKVLGHRHHQRDVPRDLYAGWRDCMLLTLAETHGEDWNPDLERQWQEAIDLAAETMLAGYERPQTY